MSSITLPSCPALPSAPLLAAAEETRSARGLLLAASPTAWGGPSSRAYLSVRERDAAAISALVGLLEAAHASLQVHREAAAALASGFAGAGSGTGALRPLMPVGPVGAGLAGGALGLGGAGRTEGGWRS